MVFLLLLFFPYSDLSNVAKNFCIRVISIQELKEVSVKREPGTCGTLRMANGEWDSVKSDCEWKNGDGQKFSKEEEELFNTK